MSQQTMLGPSVSTYPTSTVQFVDFSEDDAELWRPLVLLELLEDGLALAVDELQGRLEDGSHRVAVVHGALPAETSVSW